MNQQNQPLDVTDIFIAFIVAIFVGICALFINERFALVAMILAFVTVYKLAHLGRRV